MLNGVLSTWCLAELKQLIEVELGVPAAQQTLKLGFPPAPVPDDGAAASLAELGISDGDTLVVDDKGPVDIAAGASAPPPTPQPVVAAPAAAAPSSAAVDQLCSMGFSAEQAAGALAAAGGDMETAVQLLLGGGSPPPRAPAAAAAPAQSAAAGAPQQRSRAYPSTGAAIPGAGGALHRRVVPADNFCLFNSVGYVCEGDRSLSAAPRLRQLVADAVLADPAKYSEVVRTFYN